MTREDAIAALMAGGRTREQAEAFLDLLRSASARRGWIEDGLLTAEQIKERFEAVSGPFCGARNDAVAATTGDEGEGPVSDDLLIRLHRLADRWTTSADEDERWLNHPRVSASEAQELPALIHQARLHAKELRALCDGEEDR